MRKKKYQRYYIGLHISFVVILLLFVIYVDLIALNRG